ncbi:hypothetical protein V4890_17415 [Ralstonia solanacearum species complex bacterium KE056]|uniref:hypothetical protein n=1 Tax=Ralstonia solanacearum species complex bacterium KE056 TaxID=3119585 RepID=UPI002FC350C4
MKKIASLFAVCCLVAGCAAGNVEIRPFDTELTGDLKQLEMIYGNYEVTDAEKSSSVKRVEVVRSVMGKPIFKFYGEKNVLLDGASPISCTLKVGDIRCGKFSFPVFTSEFPYIWMRRISDGENYPPKPSGGLLGPARQMTVIPGGYRMSFVLDYRDRNSDLALKKLN